MKDDINILKSNIEKYQEKLNIKKTSDIYNELIKPGIDSINNLEKDKLKKLISLKGIITSKNKNSELLKEKEVRMILAAAIYLDNYFELVKNLQTKELGILSFYSSFSLVSEYEYLPVLFDKEILKKVTEVTNSITKGSDMLIILKKNIVKGEVTTRKEALDFIKNNYDLIYSETAYELDIEEKIL